MRVQWLLQPGAMRAAAALSAEQHEQLRFHLHQIGPLAQAATSMPDWLRTHRTQSGGCPFLNAHGACGIYSVRPASCRALLATREPRWCTMDFSTLASSEKQAFMASLDRSVVAFPLHYVAAAREYGERLERILLQAMAAEYGFALYGNLPALVWLERELGLGKTVAAGRAATEELLAAVGLSSPFLITRIE
jgi:Fe-S-cluster containining protein